MGSLRRMDLVEADIVEHVDLVPLMASAQIRSIIVSSLGRRTGSVAVHDKRRSSALAAAPITFCALCELHLRHLRADHLSPSS